ncbi:hypothetical protein XU18_0629 [Perkinsela sp. CCAP 1560/4]|nr:hypothetical protein XU18_5175 [Perkinsela sp. CCAP 1560/4]KNH09119.1 hypothetical protein XU18_0629 [Perkinsela sp. CCAP 1560/4]|eukprot:KNH01386.1 hypothetical protein XU18_5175 [Perkinsela sp. CCAP 1560/4]
MLGTIISRSLANTGNTALCVAVGRLGELLGEFETTIGEKQAECGEAFQKQFQTVEKLCTIEQFAQSPTHELRRLLRIIQRMKLQSSAISLLRLYLGRHTDVRNVSEGTYVGGFTKKTSHGSNRYHTPPSQGPMPSDYEQRFMEYSNDPTKMHYQSSSIPHWILTDPEIALSKQDRKDDPW